MQQEKVNINIDPSKTTPIVCEKCGCDKFIPMFFLRKVSRFITGETQDRVIPIDTLACLDCGHVNDSMNVTKNLDNNQNKTKQNG
tara:strand:+ start:495 stop:749 length:255 start_codon:yes stop_codon:yes gene_type:complete